MQCPPTPTLGVNFINPYGLVEAASITLFTSTPMAEQNFDNSFTKDILTNLKLFSKSLAVSATSNDSHRYKFDIKVE